MFIILIKIITILIILIISMITFLNKNAFMPPYRSTNDDDTLEIIIIMIISQKTKVKQQMFHKVCNLKQKT